ncbi:MAG: ASKHA domain-containing protein [Firmicutes bacterium]|nr:ASKHA domain-containing protein [Bacillota bacterium]
MPSFSVLFLPDHKQAVIEDNETILHSIVALEIPLKASCGGKGTCNRCRVLLKEGQVRSVSTGKLTAEQQAQGYILACQSFPVSDLVVEIPAASRLSEHRVVVEDSTITEAEDSAGTGATGAAHAGADITPLYTTIDLTIPAPTLDETEDDLGRLCRAIRKETGIEQFNPHLDVLRTLPSVLRQADWQVTVALAEQAGGLLELADVQPGSGDKKHYGLAIDIGTTTVAAELIDLANGRVMAVKGTYNKQAVFGDDVISRIIYTTENQNGLQELQNAVVLTINNLIAELGKELAVEPEDIRTAVIAGNTTMNHLFLGIDPTYIRLEPYTPAVKNIPPLRAHRLGLQIHPQAWVHCIPGIASYVGGDITSGVLVTGMADQDPLTLFIDIGTNGEMVLGNKEWLISCACSAGPAFEGGGIRHGMRSMEGAIEHVTIAPESFDVQCQTVGDAAPIGICGSGLIEIISGLRQAGLIDRKGNFVAGLNTPRLRDAAEGPEFVLAWSGESGNMTDITIAETEIKTLIRSKAAVYAGIRSMLLMVGLAVADIERIIIAGGFGKYINIRDAINIGLLPDMPLDKYTYIGNSSVAGAKKVLLSKQAREQIEDIAAKISYLELSVGNIFMEEFVSAIFIPHTDPSLFPSV